MRPPSLLLIVDSEIKFTVSGFSFAFIGLAGATDLFIERSEFIKSKKQAGPRSPDKSSIFAMLPDIFIPCHGLVVINLEPYRGQKKP